MKYILLALLFLPLFGCQSKSAKREAAASREVTLPAREMESAVVNVMITYVGLPLNYGTGFFVSSEGHFLTNAHVLGPAISGRMMKQPAVVTIDGKRFASDEIQVLDCFGKRNHDLCLLKLETKPAKFFDVAKMRDPRDGEALFHLSIPDGKKEVSYLGTAGARVLLREDDGRFVKFREGDPAEDFIEHVTITAPTKTGASGGPVISAEGALAGVTTLGDEVGSETFAITGKEVASFVRASPPLRGKPFRDYQTSVAAEVRRLFHKRYTTLQRQDLNLARAGFELNEKQWSVAKLTIGGQSFQHLVTREIPCKADDGEESTGLACRFRVDDYFGGVRLEVLKKTQSDILKLDGQKPAAEPTSLAQALKNQKLWAPVEAKLGARTRDAFYSHPGPYKCRRSAEHVSPALKSWKFCEQRGTNTPDLDSGRVTLLLQDARGWVVRATAESDPEVAIELPQGFAEVMLYSLRPAESVKGR